MATKPYGDWYGYNSHGLCRFVLGKPTVIMIHSGLQVMVEYTHNGLLRN